MDQQVGRGLLNDLAVEASLQRASSRIWNFITGNEPWSKCTGTCEDFARHELMRMRLPVADTAIVVARISRHMIQCCIRTDVPARRADDDGEFTLEVQPLGHRGSHDRLQMSHLAAGEARKEHRLFQYRAPGFR